MQLHGGSMNKNSEKVRERRSVMGGLGMAALAGVAMGVSPVSGQQAGSRPVRYAQDDWMDAVGGDHRVFIDSSSTQGGSNALRYGVNILNAQVNGYGGSDADMSMIICFRHASTLFGFNDAMWEKYGRSLDIFGQLDLAEDAEPSTNPQARAIAGMVDRGVHFAVCSSATRFTAITLARNYEGDADTIFEELSDNTVTNGHMVPAGVMAVTRAQERGYSLLYSDL